MPYTQWPDKTDKPLSDEVAAEMSRGQDVTGRRKYKGRVADTMGRNTMSAATNHVFRTEDCSFPPHCQEQHAHGLFVCVWQDWSVCMNEAAEGGPRGAILSSSEGWRMAARINTKA